MSVYQTRIEYTNGFPYEVRIHRTLDRRKIDREHRGPSVQQQMNADAMRSLASLHHSNFDSNYTGRLPWHDCPTYNVTSDSQPEYGSVLPFTCAWGYKEWMTWYNALSAANGADSAAATWGGAFDKTGTTEWAFYKDTQEFRDFCTNNNLIAKSIVLQAQAKAIDVKKNASANAENLLNHTEKIPGNIAGAADNATGSAEKILKWLPWLAGGVLLVIVFAWTYISITNKKLAV